VVRAEGLSKIFARGEERVVALKDVSFEVEKGDFVAVCGPSGSGKTTLLAIIGGLTRPTSGLVIVDGVYLDSLSPKELAAFRREKVGFAFQFSGLIPSLTVRENIAITFLLGGKVALRKEADLASRRVEELAEELGISSRLDAYPSEISGGEARRASLARALVKSPPLLLADEPTGDLDEESAALIEKVLKKVNFQKTTVIMVTHSRKLAKIAKRTLYLRKGKLEKES